MWRKDMMKLLNEFIYDFKFIKSHTLQPTWYKVFKIVLVFAVILGYYLIFGSIKTIIFALAFFILSLSVHMTYRVKTEKFTKTWLDFVVLEEGDHRSAESIGKFYYLAIILNVIISFVLSQVFG
jgi:hypothetical protein